MAEHPVGCTCLYCLLNGDLEHRPLNEGPLRLVTSHTERVIDARTSIYGTQLRELVDWFEQQTMSLSSVEKFCTDLRSLADRMDPRPDAEARRPHLQEVPQ